MALVIETSSIRESKEKTRPKTNGQNGRIGVMVYMDVSLKKRIDRYRVEVGRARSEVVEAVVDDWLRERGF